MPSRLHEALIEHTLHDHLVGHLSRDSTAIEGREKPTPKPPQPAKPKRKRGRPRKGEQRPPKEPRRLQRQPQMTLAQMIEDLPRACDVGTKRKVGDPGVMKRLFEYLGPTAMPRGRIGVSAQRPSGA